MIFKPNEVVPFIKTMAITGDQIQSELAILNAREIEEDRDCEAEALLDRSVDQFIYEQQEARLERD